MDGESSTPAGDVCPPFLMVAWTGGRVPMRHYDDAACSQRNVQFSSKNLSKVHTAKCERRNTDCVGCEYVKVWSSTWGEKGSGRCMRAQDRSPLSLPVPSFFLPSFRQSLTESFSLSLSLSLSLCLIFCQLLNLRNWRNIRKVHFCYPSYKLSRCVKKLVTYPKGERHGTSTKAFWQIWGLYCIPMA